MYLVRREGWTGGGALAKTGAGEDKVPRQTVSRTVPRGVISVWDRVGGLLETNMLTSLNEPCKVEDTSWIKPCGPRSHGGTGMSCRTARSLRFLRYKQVLHRFCSAMASAHGIYGYAETPWYYDDASISGWAGPMRTLQNRYRA